MWDQVEPLLRNHGRFEKKNEKKKPNLRPALLYNVLHSNEKQKSTRNKTSIYHHISIRTSWAGIFNPKLDNFYPNLKLLITYRITEPRMAAMLAFK